MIASKIRAHEQQNQSSKPQHPSSASSLHCLDFMNLDFFLSLYSFLDFLSKMSLKLLNASSSLTLFLGQPCFLVSAQQ